MATIIFRGISQWPFWQLKDMDTLSVFEILIRENTGMLIAYLRSGVRDDHDVDDLYQEVVFTAWKRLDDFDRERPFGPWLRGIASNTVLAYYRKSKRKDALVDRTALEWLDQRFDAIQSRPGDTLQDKLSALRDCISELPETYQAPITLRYLEQQTREEVTNALQLTKETLKKRITRAKSRLANCLERKLGLTEPGT